MISYVGTDVCTCIVIHYDVQQTQDMTNFLGIGEVNREMYMTHTNAP